MIRKMWFLGKYRYSLESFISRHHAQWFCKHGIHRFSKEPIGDFGATQKGSCDFCMARPNTK